MIHFLDILSFLFTWGSGFVFFWLTRTFLPLRGNIVVKVVAFLICGVVADSVVYSNDLPSLLGPMAGFFVYILIFYSGAFVQKISLLLLFYPVLIAVNYLMVDIGSRIFFGSTGATGEEVPVSDELQLVSTAIHTTSTFLRLLFWTGAWLALRKFLPKVTGRLNTRMWLIMDMLMMASFVGIFTIVYFMPENIIFVYPICGASIFSSFGCMYLAAYICEAAKNALRTQELERQRNYYKDKNRDEERVRGIYHDLKNHLLVLKGQSGNSQAVQESIQELQEQIQEYENYYHTGNDILDVIIRDKAKTAQEKQIDFSALISFKDGEFIEPLDMGTIFGNALDNAIEASEKLPKEQRLITVKADRVRDMLLVAVQNNTLPDAPVTGRTGKNDTFLHGFGLPNIKHAVGKYGGECSVKSEKGVFNLKIMIPVP